MSAPTTESQGAVGGGTVRSEPASPCALVTGASSGIGAAFARALHRRGERLVLVARRTDRLEALAAELGGRHGVIAADLAAPGAAGRLLEAVESRGLLVDLLVNNAGLGHTKAFAEEPIEAVRSMIDLNVRALTELTQQAMRVIRTCGSSPPMMAGW